MALVTLTASAEVHIGDIHKTLAAGDTVQFSRHPSEIPLMASVAKALADGSITMTVAYTADELASGLMAPPASVEAADAAPVAADASVALGQVARKALAAGVVGAPVDDIILVTPQKMRIVDVWGMVTTAVALSTIEIRDAAAGAGNLLGAIDSATTGPKINEGVLASQVVAAGTTLYAYRDVDDLVVGEVFVLLRPEV